MSDTYNIGPTVPGLFAAHESRLKEAADEIDRLRATLENLLKYAWHKPGCEKCCVPIGYHSCTCGYDALMRKWRKNQILCVANPTTDQATASDAGGNEMNTGCLRCGRLPGNSHTEICALQGEIERLRHDIKRHIAIASELATENEGLRDELARKAEGYTRLAEVHEGAMKLWESQEREAEMKAYEMAAELKGKGE